MIHLITLLTTLFFCVIAVRHEPHLHSEVKIVGYTGPLNKEILSLFRNAEIMEFIECNITFTPDRILALVPKLKKMFVYDTSCYNIHPEVAECDSNKIEEYEFVRSTWQDPPLETWNSFKHLKKLVIAEPGAPFVELKANSLNRTKLEYLELSYSGIQKIHNLTFNNLVKLETLILAGNKLKDFSKDILAPLKNLKTLNLRGNLLESFGTSQLPQLPNLERIILTKNPLKSLDLGGVEKVAPNLKSIDVSDTLITEEQLKSLRKSSKIDIIKNS